MRFDPDAEGNDAEATPYRIVRRSPPRAVVRDQPQLEQRHEFLKVLVELPRRRWLAARQALDLGLVETSIEIGLDSGHHSRAAQSREVSFDCVVVLLRT